MIGNKTIFLRGKVVEDIRTKEILEEIADRIKWEVLERLSDSGDDWYTASVVNDCLDIINEYM